MARQHDRQQPAERFRLRQEKSVALLKSLHQWLFVQKPQVLPKSPIAAAIGYVFNQCEALNRYATDGDLHIDNNLGVDKFEVANHEHAEVEVQRQAGWPSASSRK